MARPQRIIDHARYAALVSQGLSQRQIAHELGLPKSTLQRIAQRLLQEDRGLPKGDNGIPEAESGPREGDIDIPEEGIGIPEGDNGIPQEGSVEALSHNDVGHPKVSQGIPVVALGVHEVSQGPPLQDIEALWPVLQEMAAWWQERRQQRQEPQGKLERATFHMQPRWVQAIRREADRTGESYANVVDRALRQYFQGRET